MGGSVTGDPLQAQVAENPGCWFMTIKAQSLIDFRWFEIRLNATVAITYDVNAQVTSRSMTTGDAVMVIHCWAKTADDLKREITFAAFFRQRHDPVANKLFICDINSTYCYFYNTVK